MVSRPRQKNDEVAVVGREFVTIEDGPIRLAGILLVMDCHEGEQQVDLFIFFSGCISYSV